MILSKQIVVSPPADGQKVERRSCARTMPDGSAAAMRRKSRLSESFGRSHAVPHRKLGETAEVASCAVGERSCR